MKKIFVLVASLFLCTLFANAQNNVIDNELQKILNQKGNDYIDVNIMFKSQMTTDDFAVLNCKSDSKDVRRELVINELKKFAEKSQRDVMSVINAEERSNSVIDIKTHWIANFINCKAKRDVIYQLASHPDVALITYNSDMDIVSNTVSETDSRAVAATSDIYPHLTQIKADKVWDLGYTGKGVIVAVLDSGTNLNHDDIKDHLWNENGKYGYNVHSPNSLPSDEGSNGHGSHCAGVVCGDGTSGKKTGVAPDAKLMTIKIVGGGRCTAQNLVEGVEKAAELGADVISLSIGRENPDENRALFRQTFTGLLQTGIAAAVAAGNDGNSSTNPAPDNVRTPGDCPPPWIHPDQQGNAGGKTSVISVGAVNENNVVSPGSSKGPVTWQNIAGYNDYPYNPGIGLIRPDIAAPGENVYSIKHDATNTYWGKSGTSMATPCVAGVMALMLEKNPNLTPADLCRIIETTASNKPATKNNSIGSGVIDALAAVQAVNFDEAIAINLYDYTRTLNTGSNLNLELTLINNGSGSTNGNTTVTISENDNYTTILTGSNSYSTMASGKTASANFVVSVDELVPDNHEVTFTVNAGTRTFDIVVTISNEFVAPVVNATANGTNVNLTWNATNNATSYNVYRDGALLTNTTFTSYTDSGLEFGTVYAYSVTSKRGDLESEHSLNARIQTEDNPDRPSPTNVVANNGTVTWTNGADDSKSSNISRKDYLAGTETSIATNVNGTSYTDNTWNSLEDGVYQYGVANTYAVNEIVYTQNFTDLYLTNSTDTYPTMNAYWYIYQEGTSGGVSNNYKWNLNTSTTNSEKTFSGFGNAAFIQSNYKNDQFLSYLVTRPMTYNEAVKLSFKYITPAWGNDINTLKVMVSRDTHTGTWEELWSSNKTDVQEWTEAVVNLNAYVGQQIYIAFVNVAGYGYCTGVDEVSIAVEGNAESRIEWSDIVGKNVNMFVQDGNWSNTDNWTAKRRPNENEKVIIDANATIESGNINVNSLVINEGKTLTINDGVILNVTGDFANTDADAFIINDGAQVFQNNEDVSATFRMNIVNPEEWGTNKTGWQFIASPLKYSKISDFVPSSYSDYDLYKYDGTKDLEWLNHKDDTYEPEVPTAPQNLLAEPTSTSTIALSWNTVEGATSYNVYNGDNFISNTNNTNAIITGLAAGTEYCYTVTAVNVAGESEKPSAICTKTITLAPQNLVANMASHSSIVLSWNAVSGAELYHVYKDNEKIASVTSMSYTVNGLNPATEYCFTVTSVGSEFLGIESEKSTPACATTDITEPTAPQNVVLVATSPYSVKLTWDPVAGAASYNIYLITGGEVEKGIEATEYIIEGLTPGMGYCYNVTAVNAKGESQPNGSNEVRTPLPTPEAPQLTATAVGSAVELTWNAPAHATTYKVYEDEDLVAEGRSSTNYTVYDLEAGEHCFTVVAVNAEGSESSASNKACAITTAQDPDTPIAENVIIGDGNSSSSALPLNAFNAYSISQQIYTRAEIGQTGSIKAVSFKYKSGVTSSCTRAVKVYLKQTTKEVFASKTDWLSMTDADLVYDGNITINNTPDEWVRIKLNLNAPFEYTGDNLVVCVYDYTNRKEDDYIYFHTDDLSETKSLYYAPFWASALDPENMNSKEGSTSTKRNQIRFSFVTGNEPAIPAAPANLMVSAGTENSLTLTWDNNDIAEIYNIYKDGVKIGQTEGTSFTVNELEAGTEYCYSVSSENETGEGEAAEVCGTTVPVSPQNLIVEAIDKTTINLSWDAVDGATSYNIYGAAEIKGITTTSYDITGLNSGETYCYTVTAVNELGESDESGRECAVAENPLCNLIFTLYDLPWGDGWRKGSKITVSYEGAGPIDLTTPTYNASASAYKETPHTLSIPKGTEVTVTYTRSANEISTGESYNIYQNSFDVKCENGVVLLVTNAEELEGGETFTFIADCTPKAPNAPVLLAAEAISSTEIALTWNSTLNATSYNVYQGSTQIANGLTETSYNVTGLTANTEFCFTVTAVNATGESDASEEVCEKTEEQTSVVTIGNGGTSTSYYVPIYDYFTRNAVSQQIYKANEITSGPCYINSIAFKTSPNSYAPGGCTRNISIYLKNTEQNYYEDSYDWVVLTSDDVALFEGTITTPTTSEWVTLEFSEPFLYLGENLAVTVNDYTGTYNSADQWASYTTSEKRSIYYSNSNAIDVLSLSSNKYTFNGTKNSQVRFETTPAPADVKVKPESVVLGKVQLGEYWSENEDLTASVTVLPVSTTITNITCDNPFFSVSGIDYTAKSMNLTVSYDKNASAGEKTGNLTITYGNGATKVVPMTATAYTPVTPDIYELAQTITFTDDAYTDTPVFANLNDDYNLPKEVNAGSTPDAVYTFELTEETTLSVNVTGTNAVAAIYSEDFNGEGGPMANNNNKGIVAGPTGPTTFFYDFNDGSLDAFNLIDAKPDGQNWGIETGILISYSWKSGVGAMEPDNYIYTKEAYYITETSKLTYKVKGVTGDPDHYAVVVSEDGENFDIVFEEDNAYANFTERPVELGAYAGKALYIGFRHYDCYNKYSVQIDDFQLTDGSTRSVKSRAAGAQINAVPYPAGRYYLVAAAEDAFTVDVTIGGDPVIPAGPTTFFYDFNDGSLDDFNLIDNGSAGYTWSIEGQSLMSYSWKQQPIGALQANDYIYTKTAYLITETSELKYKVSGVSYAPDNYSVVISEDGINFTSIFTEYTPSTLDDRTITDELRVHAGKVVYIGFYHYDYDKYNIRIDDFQLTDGSAKSVAPAAKMTDIKGGFEKVSAFGTSSGTELSKFETEFEQGVGYLASYETETVATFKGILHHEKSYEFNLGYNSEDELSNYYLLGNPFSFNMNWANTTANDLANGYAVVNEQGGYNYLTSGEIKVGDGFFVKAIGSNPTLSYNQRSSRNIEEVSSLNVIASGKAGNDNVIVNLAGEQEGFPKIKNFNEDIALVYVLENGAPYGIYNCNSDALEVELVFKSKLMGEYNIHIEPTGEFKHVVLVDKVSGIETDMLTRSYSFTTTPQENGNRFVLKFAKGNSTVEQDKFAFMSGEELIFNTEGVVQIIDVMGRVVYSSEVTSDNNRINVSNFSQAAYVVRLINGDGAKTQKIVVY